MEKKNMMSKRKFDVKREQLTYEEYTNFIIQSTSVLIDYNGDYAAFAKEMIFKYYFTIYYLDVELPEDEKEAYPIFCNINCEDYKDRIAWNQYLDLRKDFDGECEINNRMVNRTINDSVVDLIDAITKFVDKYNDILDETNIGDTTKMLKDFEDMFGGMTEEQIVDRALDKLIASKKSSEDNDDEKPDGESEEKKEDVN